MANLVPQHLPTVDALDGQRVFGRLVANVLTHGAIHRLSWAQSVQRVHSLGIGTVSKEWVISIQSGQLNRLRTPIWIPQIKYQ